MKFVLTHRHNAAECTIAYAAWKGFESSLRHSHALGSCASDAPEAGEHLLVWTVDAEGAEDALALLPPWVASRTEARRVDQVAIP